MGPVKMSMRSMKAVADINVEALIKEMGITYFPYMESLTQIGYACGKYGWNADLRKGDESGVLYYVGYNGSAAAAPNRLVEKMGARERKVIANLDHAEVIESRSRRAASSSGRAAMKFVASDGSSFEVTCTDDGHCWDLCG